MDSLFMEDIFSLDIEEPIIPDTARTDLYEMCHLLDEIEYLETVNDPWYLSEAVVNPNEAKKGNIRKFGRQTIGMYNDITDANARMINQGVGIFGKICQLCVNLYTAISKFIGWIPDAIAKLASTIVRIPSNIIHKIRGDLSLYITIDTIEVMYKKNVIKILNDLINDGNTLMKGDFFDRLLKGVLTTTVSKIASKVTHNLTRNLIKPSDKQLGKRIIDNARILNNITFHKTNVNMNNPELRDAYFGNNTDGNNKIQFKTDKQHVTHTRTTYVEALKMLSDSIVSKQNVLKNIVDEINKKILRSELNNNWDKLDENYKSIIHEAISGIKTSITFTANILKYISADIKTYNDVLKKLQNKAAKKSQAKTESSYNEGFFKDLFSPHSQSNGMPLKPHKRTELNDDEHKILNEIIPHINNLIRYDSRKIIPGSVITHDEDLASITKSKIGGIPYWPKGKPWPSDEGAKYYCILQINLADLDGMNPSGFAYIKPNIPNRKGIVQYFALVNSDDAPYADQGICIWHENINSPADTSVPYISSVSDLGDLSQFTMAATPKLITFEKCYDQTNWNHETRYDIYQSVNELVKKMYDGRTLQIIDPEGLIYDKIIEFINSECGPIPHRYSGIDTLESEYLSRLVDVVLIDQHGPNHNVVLRFGMYNHYSIDHGYNCDVDIGVYTDAEIS